MYIYVEKSGIISIDINNNDSYRKGLINIMIKLVGLIILAIVVLYFILIMPRLFNRPDYRPFYGYYYAHRGFHDMASQQKCPENSYSAIKKAVERGYGIEFDVHLTKDNVPVVFHDDNLKRICGVDADLRDFTFDELKRFRLLDTDERIPLFKDVLELVDGKVPLIIEYKVEKGNADTLCSICNEMLLKYNGLYCIESFHPMAVRWYRKHRPDIVRGQLSEDFTREKMTLPYFLLAHLIGNCYAMPDFVSYNCRHRKELSRTLCRKLYRCLSVAWTVRSQKELDEIASDFDLYIFEGFTPAKG